MSYTYEDVFIEKVSDAVTEALNNGVTKERIAELVGNEWVEET